MGSVLKDLFSSKKFVVFIVASLATILLRLSNKFGIGIDEDSAQQISLYVAGLAATYVGAQGIADFGKSASVSDKPQTPIKDIDKQ